MCDGRANATAPFSLMTALSRAGDGGGGGGADSQRGGHDAFVMLDIDRSEQLICDGRKEIGTGRTRLRRAG
jgi:hypothetical protein